MAKRIGLILVGVAALLWAVDVVGNLNITGTLTAAIVDFTGSTSTAPMKTGTSLPGTCSVGQTFFKTDATAGQNIYLCTAANTWTQVQGSSGTQDGKRDLRYVLMETEFVATYNFGSSPSYWASFGDFVFYRGGSNGFNGSVPADSNRVGVARIATAATANDRQRWSAHIAHTTADTDSLYGQSAKPWEFIYIFRYPTASDYASSEFFAGIGSNSDNDPAGGVGVRYVAGTDTNFTFYASGAGGSWGATLSSGVAPDTNWHKLKIRSDGATQYKVWVSLDDGTERSVCPSGCDLTLASSGSYGAWRSVRFSIKTTTTATKTLEMDYMRFWMDWGTR